MITPEEDIEKLKITHQIDMENKEIEYKHDENREKKLLLNRREINKIEKLIRFLDMNTSNGIIVVPTP